MELRAAGPKDIDMDRTLGLKAIEIAETFLGQHEATGHNDGKFVNECQDFVKPNHSDHGAPWCACFASYMIHKAALVLGLGPSVPFMPKSDSSTSLYAWCKKHGKLLPHPAPGAIGFRRGGQPDKTHNHTFMVRSVDVSSGVVHSIDGNEGNAVAHGAHSIAGCDFAEIT